VYNTRLPGPPPPPKRTHPPLLLLLLLLLLPSVFGVPNVPCTEKIETVEKIEIETVEKIETEKILGRARHTSARLSLSRRFIHSLLWSLGARVGDGRTDSKTHARVDDDDGDDERGFVCFTATRGEERTSAPPDSFNLRSRKEIRDEFLREAALDTRAIEARGNRRGKREGATRWETRID